MALQHQIICSGTNSDESCINWILKNANPPPSSTPKIPRVPSMVKETRDYDKYYVPKVVSIGPYHSRNTKLQFLENLKPVFTMKLLSNNSETLKSLYRKLGEPTMVKTLRNFYEEKSTDGFSDCDFTKMMILDGCFILYYIQLINDGKVENFQMNNHQIVFVHQDLFLLENQIPYPVLSEVMKLVTAEWRKMITTFIHDIILERRRKKRRRWWFCFRTDPIQNDDHSSINEPKGDFTNLSVDHLLQILHHTLIKKDLSPKDNPKTTHSDRPTKKDIYDRCTFRNVNELIDVGIKFKPSKTMRLDQIVFKEHYWWFFSASFELPPITIDDSTKPRLLNLIAHEMCSDDDGREAWVTSYICLLDSLIDHPEDVKALRKAGVLDNSLGSDNEVAKLFNEIGTDLVPNIAAFSDAKNNIQEHYDSLRNSCFSQLKHEYIKTPWSFLALLGAIMALVLSGVQTYFSVWSTKSNCDDLCLFLKMNHHL